MHDNSVEDINAASELIRLRATNEAMRLHHAREVEQLEEGMGSRKVIGQAIGLVMGEYQLNEGAAFEILRRRSSHANVKLRDIAGEIVDAANSGGRHLRSVADC